MTSNLISLTIKANKSVIKYSDGKDIPVVHISGVWPLKYEYRYFFCNYNDARPIDH